MSARAATNAAGTCTKNGDVITTFPFGIGATQSEIFKRFPAAQTMSVSSNSISVISIAPSNSMSDLFILNEKMNFPPRRAFYFINKKHGVVGVWLDLYHYDSGMSELPITGFQRGATGAISKNIGRKPDVIEDITQSDKEDQLIPCLFRNTSKQAYTMIDDGVDEKYRWNPAGGCGKNQCKLMSSWHNKPDAAKKSHISNVSLSTVAYTPHTATASLYVDYLLPLSAEEKSEYQNAIEAFIKERFPRHQ